MSKPSQAGGFDVGGMLGGIMQGAIQADLQRQQFERQQQMLQQQELYRQQVEETLRRQTGAAQNGFPPPNGPTPQPAPNPALYAVDGRAPGQILSPQALPNDFHCYASEQFGGYQWCRSSKPVNDVLTATAILLTPTNAVAYYSKFFQSANFQNGAVAGELQRLSGVFHEQARVIRRPAGPGDLNGVIATWGGLTLNPVDPATINALAGGATVNAGILIDFLGDPRASAKRGLPVYSISGTAGYYWVARYDHSGRGMLRYGSCDASAIKVGPPPAPPAPPVVQVVAAAAAPRVVDVAPVAPKPPDAPAVATHTPAALAAMPSSTIDQGRRVALVIGNSAYQNVPDLANPRSDATALADVLKQDGFDTMTLIDGTLPQMKKTLRDFQDRADKADWALVYYAGHGIEAEGENYLIPVDAQLTSTRDVPDEAVSLTSVRSKLQGASKLQMVILDACRENPFRSQLERQANTRGLGSRGLARIENTARSELIFYAARDGEEADDGQETGHSPFAQALINRLASPGVEVNKTFRLVISDVWSSTHTRQQPFVYGSTPGTDDYFFRPGPGSTASAATPVATH